MSTNKKKVKYGLENLSKDFGVLTFADLILMQREDAEQTQVEFARSLGLSKQKLCDFEKGRRLPSPKMAEKWAKKLKHPAEVWVQVVLQDQLRRENVKMTVNVAS